MEQILESIKTVVAQVTPEWIGIILTGIIAISSLIMAFSTRRQLREGQKSVEAFYCDPHKPEINIDLYSPDHTPARRVRNLQTAEIIAVNCKYNDKKKKVCIKLGGDICIAYEQDTPIGN